MISAPHLLPDHIARHGDAPSLAQALVHTRARTLGLMDAWTAALPTLQVPYATTLNPPLWEWGHVAWFQEWWIGRNLQRALGVNCAPDHARPPSHLAGADALYNSSQVAHATRWHLALPGLNATRHYLAQVQQDTLALLHGVAHDDDALYFWRLALLHEDMHNEASVYMAQALGLALPEALAFRAGAEILAAPTAATALAVPAQTWRLGARNDGFAFDNELTAHAVALPAFQMDASAVTWGRYLPFLQATGHTPPPHTRQQDGQWQQCRLGQWRALNPAAPAVHLRASDAQAWCDWAGRRLPTEAEWECAAATQPGLQWGQVWEWTASDFQAYPGFVAHPYRAYSAPWFGTHRVLRGASAATSAYLLNVRYRNFFTPERHDILAGFRTVNK